MTISSVSSNSSSQVSNIKPSAPPVATEKEHDGDKDDGASSKINSTAPTVNSSGQTTGTTISVTA